LNYWLGSALLHVLTYNLKPRNEALVTAGISSLTKILTCMLFFLSLNTFASESNIIKLNFDFSEVLLKQPKLSKLKDTSFVINKYIQENYSFNTEFSCGLSVMTPDQELKYEYETDMIKIVARFGYSNNFKVFTPIRQLVLNPDKGAVFNGYYFV
jgi:hypothetical protein